MFRIVPLVTNIHGFYVQYLVNPFKTRSSSWFRTFRTWIKKRTRGNSNELNILPPLRKSPPSTKVTEPTSTLVFDLQIRMFHLMFVLAGTVRDKQQNSTGTSQ